jgi:hypothetical protein
MKGNIVSRLQNLLLSLSLVALAAGTAQAQKAAPACAAEAAAQAEVLLKFHVTEGGKAPELAEDVAPVDIGDVESKGRLKPLRGKGRYEVLEVTGHVIKAEYRIHLIYAEMQDQCLLMGQEILEVDSPF